MNSCASYKYMSPEGKCVLLDEQGELIWKKKNFEEIEQSAAEQQSIEVRCSRKGFTYLPTSNACVKLRKKLTTWSNAMKICRSENAALAVIKTAKKQKDITEFLKSNKIMDVWIGAKDLYDNNTHMWYDGSVLNYTAWGPLQPSHTFLGIDKENCVQMISLMSYLWNDRPCDSKFNVMCETDTVK